MKSRILYSLTAGLVVGGCALAADSVSANFLPRGKTQEAVRRFLSEPGQRLKDKLEDSKDLRDLSRRGRQALETSQEKLRLYNIGAWTAAGFLLCLLMTIFFGVSTFGAAVSLGLKAALTLIFLQGALIFAGVLHPR